MAALKHHADVAPPEPVQLRPAELIQAGIAEPNAAAARGEHPRQQLQVGSFAATRCPQQQPMLAGLAVQIRKREHVARPVRIG